MQLPALGLAALLAASAAVSAPRPPVPAAQDAAPAADTHLPPEVGDVAPPIGRVTWYTTGHPGRGPSLADLRGDVVVVHTWGYYCESCVRAGVPMVVDLMRANGDQGLRCVSLTCPITDGKPDDHFVGVGREMGIEHPMALTGSYGEYTPYLNLNHQSSLTWCTVVGRHGAVTWRGDPSTDGDELLEAVRRALDERDAPDLGAPYAEPVRAALSELVAGEYGEALDTARELADRHAKRRGDEAAAVAADAARLAEVLADHRAALVGRAEASRAAGDAEGLARAARALTARFPDSDAAERVEELREGAADDPALGPALAAWEAWLAVAAERPPLFPARADRDAKRYAKDLEDHLEDWPEGPGAEPTRAWLAAHAAALEADD